MKYTPNKIKEFVAENYIFYPRDNRNKPITKEDDRLVPVVQRVILREIVNATIDSGCRVIWLNSY